MLLVMNVTWYRLQMFASTYDSVMVNWRYEVAARWKDASPRHGTQQRIWSRRMMIRVTDINSLFQTSRIHLAPSHSLSTSFNLNVRNYHPCWVRSSISALVDPQSWSNCADILSLALLSSQPLSWTYGKVQGSERHANWLKSTTHKVRSLDIKW